MLYICLTTHESQDERSIARASQTEVAAFETDDKKEFAVKKASDVGKHWRHGFLLQVYGSKPVCYLQAL